MRDRDVSESVTVEMSAFCPYCKIQMKRAQFEGDDVVYCDKKDCPIEGHLYRAHHERLTCVGNQSSLKVKK